MTDTITYRLLLTDVSDNVATIKLNRPPRNEFTFELGDEFAHALATYEADDAVRAIVVTGEGKYFCAGAALGGRVGGQREIPDDERRAREERQQQLRAVPRHKPWEMSTPIIAAMNGSAVGVGMTWPLQWDIRFAAEDAKYGFVFIRRGWVPELAAHWLLPRVVGLSNAMDLLLSGRVFDGREGERLGLFSKALPADDVLPYALEYAKELAANCAPVSAAISKKLVYRMLEESSHTVAQETDNRLYGWTARQPDGREGVVSFLEKRPPKWTMSKTADLPAELR